MADQVGSPERLMEVTSQPRPTATLHIRDPGHGQRRKHSMYGLDPQVFVPRNPLPPQTTIFFAISPTVELVEEERSLESREHAQRWIDPLELTSRFQGGSLAEIYAGVQDGRILLPCGDPDEALGALKHIHLPPPTTLIDLSLHLSQAEALFSTIAHIPHLFLTRSVVVCGLQKAVPDRS